MASPLDNFNFPHSPPPPAPKPPSPLIPPPAPDSDSTTVIVIVFVSFGGLLFLAFLAVALCCFIKKKKKKKMVQETDTVHVDEHLKVKEAIVPGPHGPQAVVLAVEDDVRVKEEILKEEKSVEGTHAKSVDMASQEGASNVHSSGHDHLDHNP